MRAVQPLTLQAQHDVDWQVLANRWGGVGSAAGNVAAGQSGGHGPRKE